MYKGFLYINESKTFHRLSSNLTANIDRIWTNQLLSLWNHYWDLCFSDDFRGNRTSLHRSNSLKIRRKIWIKQIWICIYIYIYIHFLILDCTVPKITKGNRFYKTLIYYYKRICHWNETWQKPVNKIVHHSRIWGRIYQGKNLIMSDLTFKNKGNSIKINLKRGNWI